jgi:hypothetical protein
MSEFRRQSLIAYGQPLRETLADRPSPALPPPHAP